MLPMLIYSNLYVPPPFYLHAAPQSSQNSESDLPPSLRVAKKDVMDDDNDKDLDLEGELEEYP